MTKETEQKERPPIVVVMGHVDHGKSTLLDYIRKTNTVDREAGGITQHVAAYEVEHDLPAQAGREGSKKRITFIDTPGHAAFQAIRARGANVADIAILVVAADDGVKAQTLEALASIRESKIPYIVAINKVDKPNADIARTQASLLEHAVYLEKLGGDVPWVAISAKAGAGVPELLDLVLLVAELNAHTADASAPAQGFVIEAHRDQKRGIAATLIVTNGTLHSGETVLAGDALAPVRIMENHLGKAIRAASFSTPILLVGFDTLPAVGVEFRAFKSKKDAESTRAVYENPRPADSQAESVSDDMYTIPLVVRADTSGSIEAIKHEIARIAGERARVSVIQSGIGTISENDIKKAAATPENPAIVIGFNVKSDKQAEERARQHGVAIELFDIIYKLTDRLEELLRDRTPKQMVEEVVGRADVVRNFSSRKDVQVVGGSVSEGYLGRTMHVRIIRRKMEVGTGKILNLQSFKQRVEKVEMPHEFGAEIDSSFEIAAGDIIEGVVTTLK